MNDEPANLNELPEYVHASDEDLYRSILIALCDANGLDRRFAYGNIMDEYHECWFENYEEWDVHFEGDDLETNPDSDLVKSEYMVAFASDDLMYYASHNPEYHVGNDVNNPPIITHHDNGWDEIDCPRCEADRDNANEDALIALGEPERVRRIREYVDTVIPANLTPYDVRPAYGVHYFELFHDDVRIGSAQFEGTTRVSIPLVREAEDSGLFLAAHPEYEIRDGRIMRKDES